MGKHKLEDYFRDRLSEQEEDIDKDMLWASLGLEEEKQQKKRPLWIIWVFGLSLLLLLVTIGLDRDKGSSNQTVIDDLHKIENKSSTEINDKTINESLDENVIVKENLTADSFDSLNTSEGNPKAIITKRSNAEFNLISDEMKMNRKSHSSSPSTPMAKVHAHQSQDVGVSLSNVSEKEETNNLLSDDHSAKPAVISEAGMLVRFDYLQTIAPKALRLDDYELSYEKGDLIQPCK